MQTFMSPASQNNSNYSSAFGGEESEQRRNNQISPDHNSLDASHSKPLKKMTNAELRDMPGGGPLLESAKSQKQFIIKKQKNGKQRGKSKGVTLMKAYFPNLVGRKDVSLNSPTNINGMGVNQS